MNLGLANLSTDLRRISYWLYQGQIDLAKKFLERCPKTYSDLNPRISCFENIWDELKKIENLKEGRLKEAERALTASVILLHQSRAKNPT